jgi:nucleoside-diphosphate-sugar epimerase
LRWLESLNVEIRFINPYEISSLANSLEDVNIIYHVAGRTRGLRKSDFIKDNFIFTKNLIEACKISKIQLKRFILVSSLSAVGPCRNSRPVTEESDCQPVITYGASKRMAEQFAIDNMPNLPITIIRPPAVYGPKDIDIYPYFKLAKLGIIISIANLKKLSIIYVKDLASGIIKASLAESAIGKTYFISNKLPTSTEEFLEIAADSFGIRRIKLRIPHLAVLASAAISDFASRLTYKASVFNREKTVEVSYENWVCSAQKAEDELSFIPGTSLRNGINETILWYKSMKWL